MSHPLLSICILVHNNPEEIRRLLAFLHPYTEKGVEVCMVDDASDPETVGILESFATFPAFRFFRRPLKKNFAAQRNFISAQARGQWIFHLDQDERPPAFFLEEFPTFLAHLEQQGIDAVGFPRINLLGPQMASILPTLETRADGAFLYPKGWFYFPGTRLKLFKKRSHILFVHPKGWVNFPGTQTRLYRNTPTIRWKYTVHEEIGGYQKRYILPAEEAFAVTHEKPLESFLGSSAFYDTFPWRHWDKLKKNISKRWRRLVDSPG